MGVARPKIICLEWEDPSSTSGWLSPEKVGTDEAGDMVVSVGMLVKETDSHIYIAMDWAKDGDTNTRGKIPKAQVKKRKEIKLPRGIWKEAVDERA